MIFNRKPKSPNIPMNYDPSKVKIKVGNTILNNKQYFFVQLYGLAPGDTCDRNGCKGAMESQSECTCGHPNSSPPCSSCENDGTWCPKCGYTVCGAGYSSMETEFITIGSYIAYKISYTDNVIFYSKEVEHKFHIDLTSPQQHRNELILLGLELQENDLDQKLINFFEDFVVEHRYELVGLDTLD